MHLGIFIIKLGKSVAFCHWERVRYWVQIRGEGQPFIPVWKERISRKGKLTVGWIGISLPLLFTAGGLLSQHIAGQLQCPYPKIVVLIQQICWYDMKICLSFTIFPQLLMTLWEKNIIKGRYWSIDYVTLSSFVMYFLSKRNLKKYMIWYHLSLSFSRFIIFH